MDHGDNDYENDLPCAYHRKYLANGRLLSINLARAPDEVGHKGYGYVGYYEELEMRGWCCELGLVERALCHAAVAPAL